jgi:3-isopropylmalate dehydrogenase
MVHGLRVLHAAGEAAGVRFDVEEIPCGGQYYLATWIADWPEGAEERCAAADVILLGAVGWPAASGRPVTMKDGKMAGWSPVIGNRGRLDLYANVRPVKLYPGVAHRIHGKHKQVWEPDKVDLVIIRRNTEGLTAAPAASSRPAGGSTSPSTTASSPARRRSASSASPSSSRDGAAAARPRTARSASPPSSRQCPPRLPDVRRDLPRVGKEYPDIEKDTAIVDAFTQWLIGQPEYYDVCVTTNMFGDIVTDLAACCRAAWGWRSAATSATATRCSSRSRIGAEARGQGQGEPHRHDPGGQGGPGWVADKKDLPELAARRRSGRASVRRRSGARRASDLRPGRRGEGRHDVAGRRRDSSRSLHACAKSGQPRPRDRHRVSDESTAR